MRRAWAQCLVAAAVSAAGEASAQPLVFDGDVPTDPPDHFFVDFEVPAGTVEIEVRHDDLSDANILDFGLDDPDGFRGWGGGNTEPAIVGLGAASRSYVPGPIAAGTWRVVVGKAKIAETPARYHIEVELRDVATLAPQPERAPYVETSPLSVGPRWYAGDFHTHSLESGDAVPDLDAMAQFARSRGLDFIVVTDHNTMTGQDFFAAVQPSHPELLLVPGVEFTTYAGHANGIGATRWVDHKIGLPGVTIDVAALAFAEQGALLALNHPVLDIGDLCIGCAWKHELSIAHIAAVEIATGGWKEAGFLFTKDAIAFWDELCAQGGHIAAIGGSDDHRAGVDEGSFQSPIANPTTMVYAESLSVPALLEGIRLGKTVVKLQGPDDPMIELASDAPLVDGRFAGNPNVRLRATVTGGSGDLLRFIGDGELAEELTIDGDPFVGEIVVTAPEGDAESRWRAEVWSVEEVPRTVTSHAWVVRNGDGAAPLDTSGGCGCRTAPSTSRFAWPFLACLALAWRVSRRRSR